MATEHGVPVGMNLSQLSKLHRDRIFAKRSDYEALRDEVLAFVNVNGDELPVDDALLASLDEKYAILQHGISQIQSLLDHASDDIDETVRSTLAFYSGFVEFAMEMMDMDRRIAFYLDQLAGIYIHRITAHIHSVKTRDLSSLKYPETSLADRPDIVVGITDRYESVAKIPAVSYKNYLGNVITVPERPTRTSSKVIKLVGDEKNLFALCVNGDLWVRGWNQNGELGLGDNEVRWRWTLCMSDVTDVWSTRGHTAIRKSDNLNVAKIWLTGHNDNGQLGTGLPGDHKNVFTMVDVSAFDTSGIKDVILRPGTSMILTNGGRVLAAGDNSDGRLGTPSLGVVPSFTDTGLSGIVGIACGNDFSFALNSNGKLMGTGNTSAYGNQADGNPLGNGSVSNLSVFTEIMADNVDFVAAGEESAIIRRNGLVYVSGYNAGHGLYTNVADGFEQWYQVMNLPFNPSKLADVKFGPTWTMTLLDDGSVWRCGKNYRGETETGLVKWLENVVNVESESFLSAVVLKDGRVYVKGENTVGDVYINRERSLADYWEPISIAQNVQKVVKIRDYTIALDNAGGVWVSRGKVSSRLLTQSDVIDFTYVDTSEYTRVYLLSESGRVTEYELRAADPALLRSKDLMYDDGTEIVSSGASHICGNSVRKIVTIQFLNGSVAEYDLFTDAVTERVVATSGDIVTPQDDIDTPYGVFVRQSIDPDGAVRTGIDGIGSNTSGIMSDNVTDGDQTDIAEIYPVDTANEDFIRETASLYIGGKISITIMRHSSGKMSFWVKKIFSNLEIRLDDNESIPVTLPSGDDDGVFIGRKMVKVMASGDATIIAVDVDGQVWKFDEYEPTVWGFRKVSDVPVVENLFHSPGGATLLLTTGEYGRAGKFERFYHGKIKKIVRTQTSTMILTVDGKVYESTVNHGGDIINDGSFQMISLDDAIVDIAAFALTPDKVSETIDKMIDRGFMNASHISGGEDRKSNDMVFLVGQSGRAWVRGGEPTKTNSTFLIHMAANHATTINPDTFTEFGGFTGNFRFQKIIPGWNHVLVIGTDPNNPSKTRVRFIGMNVLGQAGVGSVDKTTPVDTYIPSIENFMSAIDQDTRNFDVSVYQEVGRTIIRLWHVPTRRSWVIGAGISLGNELGNTQFAVGFTSLFDQNDDSYDRPKKLATGRLWTAVLDKVSGRIRGFGLANDMDSDLEGDLGGSDVFAWLEEKALDVRVTSDGAWAVTARLIAGTNGVRCAVRDARDFIIHDDKIMVVEQSGLVRGKGVGIGFGGGLTSEFVDITQIGTRTLHLRSCGHDISDGFGGTPVLFERDGAEVDDVLTGSDGMLSVIHDAEFAGARVGSTVTHGTTTGVVYQDRIGPSGTFSRAVRIDPAPLAVPFTIPLLWSQDSGGVGEDVVPGNSGIFSRTPDYVSPTDEFPTNVRKVKGFGFDREITILEHEVRERGGGKIIKERSHLSRGYSPYVVRVGRRIFAWNGNNLYQWIYVYDTVTHEGHSFGGLFKGMRYMVHVEDRSEIWCIPCDADRVVVIDTTTETFREVDIGNPPGIWRLWGNGVYDPVRKRIVCPPDSNVVAGVNQGMVLEIDPSDGSTTKVNIPGGTYGADAFSKNGVFVPGADVCVWAPFRNGNKRMLVIGAGGVTTEELPIGRLALLFRRVDEDTGEMKLWMLHEWLGDGDRNACITVRESHFRTPVSGDIVSVNNADPKLVTRNTNCRAVNTSTSDIAPSCVSTDGLLHLVAYGNVAWGLNYGVGNDLRIHTEEPIPLLEWSPDMYDEKGGTRATYGMLVGEDHTTRFPISSCAPYLLNHVEYGNQSFNNIKLSRINDMVIPPDAVTGSLLEMTFALTGGSFIYRDKVFLNGWYPYTINKKSMVSIDIYGNIINSFINSGDVGSGHGTFNGSASISRTGRVYSGPYMSDDRTVNSNRMYSFNVVSETFEQFSKNDMPFNLSGNSTIASGNMVLGRHKEIIFCDYYSGHIVIYDESKDTSPFRLVSSQGVISLNTGMLRGDRIESYRNRREVRVKSPTAQLFSVPWTSSGIFQHAGIVIDYNNNRNRLLFGPTGRILSTAHYNNDTSKEHFVAELDLRDGNHTTLVDDDGLPFQTEFPVVGRLSYESNRLKVETLGAGIRHDVLLATRLGLARLHLGNGLSSGLNGMLAEPNRLSTSLNMDITLIRGRIRALSSTIDGTPIVFTEEQGFVYNYDAANFEVDRAMGGLGSPLQTTVHYDQLLPYVYEFSKDSVTWIRRSTSERIQGHRYRNLLSPIPRRIFARPDMFVTDYFASDQDGPPDQDLSEIILTSDGALFARGVNNDDRLGVTQSSYLKDWTMVQTDFRFTGEDIIQDIAFTPRNTIILTKSHKLFLLGRNEYRFAVNAVTRRAVLPEDVIPMELLFTRDRDLPGYVWDPTWPAVHTSDNRIWTFQKDELLYTNTWASAEGWT